MAKYKKYILAWGAPPDPDVVGYLVRFAPGGTPIDYDTPAEDVGNVSQVDLPLPNTPLIDGDIAIGVSSVDDAGNESDIAVLTAPFDFLAPSPPTNLHIL